MTGFARRATAVTITIAILGLGAVTLSSVTLVSQTAGAEVVWPPSPTLLPGSAPDADSAQVASLGGNGDAVSVWDNCGCGTAGVEAAMFDGFTWSGQQTISDLGADDAYEPQVAATSPGHAIAVWTQDDGSDLTIQTSTYGPSGWSTPVPISGTSGDVFAPQVAGQPDGTAAAIWLTTDANAPAVDVQTTTFDGATWSTPLTITDSSVSGEDADDPHLAATAAGTAVGVWTLTSQCECSGTIQASTFTSATASPVEDLSAAADDTVEPVITSTGGSTAVAAWANVGGSSAFIEAKGYDGTQWSVSAETVSDPSEDVSPFGPPEITSTATGQATVVWSGFDTDDDSVVFASQRVAGAWSARVELSTPLPSGGGELYLTPDITTVDPGVALAVWQASDFVAGTATLQAATYDGGAVVGPANVAVTNVAPFFALPQVEGTGDGTAVTVWIDDDGIAATSVQSALGAPSARTKPGAGGDVTLSTSAGGFLHVKRAAVPASPPPPAGVVFPYGLFSFDIVNLPSPGASATVTVTLPGPVTQYWKLQHDTWTQLMNATFTTNHVTFTLTDGGTGDADGVENGTIVDPGAPAVVGASAPPTVVGPGAPVTVVGPGTRARIAALPPLTFAG